MASAVGGARDGRGETPRTLETYPRVTSEPGGARGLFRGVPPPRARRRRRVRRDARQVARPRVRRGHLGSPKRTRPRRPSRRRPSRRSEETRKNGRRAKTRGRRGKRRRRERRRRRREVPRSAAAARRAVVEGLGESDDSGDEMDARRRCTPRARESRRVTETPISRRSWRRSWRRFSRAPRGIRRLRNPRPSRETRRGGRSGV